MKKIEYKILTDKGLLVQNYAGELTREDMTDFFKKLYEDPDYPIVTEIFSDFTNALVALAVDDIIEVAYFIIEHAPRVKHIRNAILVNEPLVTAYSILYKEVMKEMPLYDCRIFSTFKESAKFIDYNVKEIKDIIKLSFPGQQPFIS
jgi:hypothetical protein